MDRIRLGLLGGFEVRLPTGASPALPAKAQALLAYLAAHLGQRHPRDKLAALLWGDRGETQARDSLRQAVRALRTALDADELVIGDRAGFALDPHGLDIDIVRFEGCVTAGTPAALEEAAALYRGDLLEGLAVSEPRFEEWLIVERERLRERALEALAKLLAHQSRVGATESAIGTAARLLSLDPLQEAVHRVLMRLYARQGRRAAALRQYQVCVSVLRRELGADPEGETRQLYHELVKAAAVPAGVERALGEPGEEPRAAPVSPPALPAYDTPIVGREPELARLGAVLDEALGGHGHVVFVVGEAGIGKTRLVTEFAAESLARDVRVLFGRGYESARILPFGPWADALRAGRALADRTALHALGDAWRNELARLFPELGEHRTRDITGGEDALRLFEALVQFVVRLAAAQPLLVVLDDVHWADEMSLRFLSFLGRRLAAVPALVVMTAREEETDDVAALGRALGELRRGAGLVEVALGRLSREATATLVCAIGRTGRDDPASERLEALVWRASAGNPFIAVETLHALDANLAGTADGVVLAPRVRDLVVERLARVSPDAADLAAVAAVIGREFDFALLQSAAGLGEHEAAAALEELVRRRLLHSIGERFDFSHDRIRRGISEQMLAPRRKVLHRDVARAIERLHGADLEPHLSALAHHAFQGELWEKAVAYLRQAGAQAMARSANREATLCFEQALEALEHLPAGRDRLQQAIDLRLDLRNSLFPLDEQERILEHLREADGLARALDDQRRLGRISTYLASAYWLAGDHEGAVKAGQEAFARAEDLQDVDLQVMADYRLGQAHYFLGNYPRAMECLRRNVTRLQGELLYKRFGMVGLPSVFSRTFLVHCLAERGEFLEAIARSGEAVRIAEAADHPFSLCHAHSAVFQVHLYRGELDEAISALERGLELCQVRSFSILIPDFAARLAYAWALRGRVREALPLIEQAIAQASSRGLSGYDSRWLAWTSEAHLLAGRAEEAVEVAARALASARGQKARGHEAWALRSLGEIHSHRDPADPATGEGHYRQALALATELGMRPLVARCHLGLGRLYGRTGKRERAREHLTTAATMLREMGMAYWLEQAELELKALL